MELCRRKLQLHNGVFRLSTTRAYALAICFCAGVTVPSTFGQFARLDAGLPRYVAAESEGRPVEGGLDVALLRDVYGLGAPWSTLMRGADASAWPVFIGAVPVAGLVALATRDRHDARFALTLAVAEGSAISVTAVLKKLFDRRRPYRALADIEARSASHRDGGTSDPYSFPSGHAAMSFAVATAFALENQSWYVVTPVYLWAFSVATSRIWLGVHYPTDVLAGAVVGIAAAILARWAAEEVLPDRPDVTVDFSSVRLFRVTL